MMIWGYFGDHSEYFPTIVDVNENKRIFSFIWDNRSYFYATVNKTYDIKTNETSYECVCTANYSTTGWNPRAEFDFWGNLGYPQNPIWPCGFSGTNNSPYITDLFSDVATIEGNSIGVRWKWTNGTSTPTILYGDSAVMRNCGHTYNGFLSLLFYESGATSAYAVFEIRK